MPTDNKSPNNDGIGATPQREWESPEGVFARIRAVACDIGERVRKALGRDDDTRPPGFNGLMLVA
ncbi:hypothetical protein R5W23_001888 [Gemmata sp. JC673]|uniref:Uncharacterized protein n=1 Tax=Gemmata algarum TaxID=2975278 RepID=A0ABU5F1L2_9BACT|nr:hypothetical protein [Gemmata algarum]MDY3560642.1 hypothetical protein [Gemmata algarum]